MKKVLEVLPYSYLPYYSGGQKSVAQFLEFLSKETDLTVLCTVNNDFSLAKNYKGLPWLIKPFARYMDIRLAWKIISLVKKEKYDVIIWEHPFLAWLAWIVRKRTGIKTIFHTHNLEYQRFRSLGKWWWPVLKVYERWAFRFADYIFFISEEERAFAVDRWKIDRNKCREVTFGVTMEQQPDKTSSRKTIADRHGIATHEKILLFNGLLSYPPNLEALVVILDQINPYLMPHKNFSYKIIVCGKGLPELMNALKDYAEKNIVYTGFVDDIETYFKGADLFLNTVLRGGGIKTKMIESIGFGTTVISTKTGATGIHPEVCGDKLVIVPDNDWKQFAEAVISNQSANTATPPSYYNYYYWGSIIGRIKEVL